MLSCLKALWYWSNTILPTLKVDSDSEATIDTWMDNISASIQASSGYWNYFTLQKLKISTWSLILLLISQQNYLFPSNHLGLSAQDLCTTMYVKEFICTQECILQHSWLLNKSINTLFVETLSKVMENNFFHCPIQIAMYISVLT